MALATSAIGNGRNAEDTECTCGVFDITLGVVGLGGCWREASRIWNAPAVVGGSVMAIAAAVWVLLILLYAAKWMWRRARR